MIADLGAPPSVLLRENVRSPKSHAQMRAFLSDAEEVAWSARVNAGKTWGVLLPVLRDAVQRPGFEQLIARNEFASLRTSTMKTWLREICTPQMVARWWRASTSEMRFPNGSLVAFAGLDKPERLLSSRWDRIVVDQCEQLDMHQWTLTQTRCRGQMVAVFNPEHPEHWANRRWTFDRGARRYTDDDGRSIEVIISGERDNHEHESAGYRRTLDALPGVYGLRLRKGIWAAHAGIIYAGVWRGAVARPAAWDAWGGYPPPDWRRVRGTDWGYQNPHATAWFAIDGDDRWWLYRQLYRAETNPEDLIEMTHAAEREECEAMSAALEARAAEYAHDPKALDALRARVKKFKLYDALSDPARPDMIKMFADRGLWSRGWNNAVYDGIMSVMTALNPERAGGSRLFVVQDSLIEECPILRERAEKPPLSVEGEIVGYRWRKDQRTATAEGPADQPVKKNDHMLDVIRGCVHTFSTYSDGRLDG